MIFLAITPDHTPPPTIQRSTRRSARNSVALPETAVVSSSLHTEASASASAVTADFNESEYTTPARASAPETCAAAAGDHAAGKTEEMASAPAVTRNRGIRVPASASPAAKSAKSTMMASTSASEKITTLSPHSVGATNTVTPPDSIKTIKAMDTPVEAVKIECATAAANNSKTGNNDAVQGDKQVRAGSNKEEIETSAANAITKEKEDSERNKTSSTPDDGKATVTAVESPGDSINMSNNNGGNKSQRGLVSRRGRFISPGRRLQPAVAAAVATATVHSPPSRNISSNNNTDAVIEYKTYRSPPRKRDEEVPSLCSTGSGHLEKEVKSASAVPAATKPPASSISCDPSMVDSTSPLASHEQADERKQPASTKNSAATAAGSRSQTPPRNTADTVRLIFVLRHYPLKHVSVCSASCFQQLAHSITFSTLCFARYSPRNPL